MVSRLLTVAALGGALAQAAITGVAVQGMPTSTQAVLAYTAPDNNACTVAVSESSTLAPLAADVDPSLYTGADTDQQRAGTFVSGRARAVVIGKRAAELALDGKRHSRALQGYTVHYYRITCGTDQATGTLVTANPPLGNTYNEVPFDRNRPGEYAFPTLDWADKTKTYVDPQSGVLVKRMSGPGEIVPLTQTGMTFSSAAALGAGWTITGLQASYSGSSQALMYYRAADPTWPGLKTPDFVQLNLVGASGTATNAADRTIDVCLTNDGVTCAGKTVQQALTNTATNYTVGNTTPILEFWRGSPNVPSTREDMRVLSGTATVAGAAVTRQGGDLFSLNWNAGSRITLDGVDCAIQTVTNENSLTLQSGSCVGAGSHAFGGRNWGVLIRKSTASANGITITSANWTLGTSGYANFPAAGTYDLCAPAVVNGPTGPGSHCATGITSAQYSSQNALFWMGADGTANLIGLSNGNNSGLAGGGTCSSGTSWAWDRTIPGLYWCLGQNTSGATVIFKVQYTGTNTAVAAVIDARLAPATTTIASGDVSAMVRAFNPAFSVFGCGFGWQLAGRSHDNLVIYCNQTTQNTPAWVAVYSTTNNAIVAATSTYGGSMGAANRWSDDHSVFSFGDDDWVLVSAGSVGDLPYQSTITSGTLSPTYSACPANPIDSSLAGQLQCSTVTVTSLTPMDPNSGQTLYGQALLAGDFFQIVRFNGSSWPGDGETVRVLAVNGQTLTVERAVRSYGYALNNNHTGSLALQVAPAADHEFWWDYVDDPLGQTLTKPYGKTLLEDPQTQDCHQGYNFGIFLAGCLKQVPAGKMGFAVRKGDLPKSSSTANPFLNPILFTNWDAGFAGNNYEMSTQGLETHPSRHQYNASALDKQFSYDARPYMGDTAIATSTTLAKAGGTTYIYRLAASATAPLTPRLQPLMMTSGVHPVVDVSPAVLQDTTADFYKGCYVVKANDCRTGSTTGEVYVNVPFAAAPYCFLSRFSTTPGLSDVCITASTDTAHHVIESGNLFDDNNGALVRRLSAGFSVFKTETAFWNVRVTPDAKWLYWISTNAGGVRNELMMLKLPPPPPLESVNRGTFVTVPVRVGPAAGMATARARFGYAENGTPSAFFCTPRQMDCTTSAPNGTPFVWSDETQTTQSCTSGCTITIPAIPGRVVYYVIERQDSNGNWTPGATQALAVK